MEKIKILERELKALGQYYRNDWSDFDGRTLRDQIDDIFLWFNNNENTEFVNFTEKLAKQDI